MAKTTAKLAWIAGYQRVRADRHGRRGAGGRQRVHGLSAPGLLSAADVARMAADPVVLALAMPDPEILPDEAATVALVTATGPPRRPQPDQLGPRLAGHLARRPRLPRDRDQRRDDPRRRER